MELITPVTMHVGKNPVALIPLNKSGLDKYTGALNR